MTSNTPLQCRKNIHSGGLSLVLDHKFFSASNCSSIAACQSTWLIVGAQFTPEEMNESSGCQHSQLITALLSEKKNALLGLSQDEELLQISYIKSPKYPPNCQWWMPYLNFPSTEQLLTGYLSTSSKKFPQYELWRIQPIFYNNYKQKVIFKNCIKIFSFFVWLYVFYLI